MSNWIFKKYILRKHKELIKVELIKVELQI